MTNAEFYKLVFCQTPYFFDQDIQLVAHLSNLEFILFRCFFYPDLPLGDGLELSSRFSERLGHHNPDRFNQFGFKSSSWTCDQPFSAF
jgi:hypothetical protein